MTIPKSATRTDVHLLPTTLKGVPDEINVARLRAHEAFYGSAGGGAPDDVEMFNRCTDGLRVKGAEWLELSRGMEREQVDADGVTHRAHHRRNSAARVLSQMARDDDAAPRRCHRSNRCASRGPPESRSRIMARLSRPEAEDILYSEARLLDERRYDDWLAMLTADAVYWMPCNGDGVDPNARGHAGLR